MEKWLLVDVNDSKSDLLMALKQASRRILKTGEPYELFIGGFDDSPIPLWAIERASEFCRNLVGLGFLSPLKMLPDIEAREIKRGWTAYEVWLCARRELGPDIDVRRMYEDASDGGEFRNAVLASNDKCDRLVAT